MKDSRIIDYLDATLSGADSAHNEALSDVQCSRNAFDGIPYGNEREGSSSIVVRDIARMVEGALPSLVEPFAGDEIVSVETDNPANRMGAKKMEALINYQWAKKHRPLEVIETVAQNMMVDGTAWLMTGWHPEGYPTAVPVPFESVIPDPAATKAEDMRFVIYRRKVSMSEILSNPDWFGKHSKASLQVLMPTTESEYDPAPLPGREDDFNPNDRSLEKIEIFEYYGWYDIDDDGIAEPIIAIWSQNTLLRLDRSPFPEGMGPIPFDMVTFTKKPFSIYGGTIEQLIGDHQFLRTSITRGIIDNMARANNGVTFIRKGSLDPINMKRLKAGEPYIELNAPSNVNAGAHIFQGNFNEIPSSVFAFSEEVQKEEENLTGITRYAIGSDSRSLNNTATGIGIISSMSQRRLIYMTRHIAAMLERVFTKWSYLNAELIDEVVVPTLQGDVSVLGSDLTLDSFGVTVRTPTEGIKEQKRQQIVAMIQSMAPMIAYTGAKPVLSLLSDMAEVMDMPKVRLMLTEAMREAEQQGQMMSQAAQMNQQVEMQKAQAEMVEKMAKAQKDAASAEKAHAEADAERYDTLLKSFGVNPRTMGGNQ